MGDTETIKLMGGDLAEVADTVEMSGGRRVISIAVEADAHATAEQAEELAIALLRAAARVRARDEVDARLRAALEPATARVGEVDRRGDARSPRGRRTADAVREKVAHRQTIAICGAEIRGTLRDGALDECRVPRGHAGPCSPCGCSNGCKAAECRRL